MGAFYYGYPVLQPFAGVLSEKIGPKRLIVFAGASAGFLNLLMPVVARWNVYALVVLRGVLGIGLVSPYICYPAQNDNIYKVSKNIPYNYYIRTV